MSLSSLWSVPNNRCTKISCNKSLVFLLTMQLSVVSILFAIGFAQAHFVLELPESLGHDDDNVGVAPCGGIDPASPNVTITKFPVRGAPVGFLTTHDHATWEFNAALLSDLDTWVPLTNILHQEGLGSFCEPSIPAPQSWAGKKGVVQLVQQGHHGNLYACARVRFVRGGTNIIPSSCFNDTGMSAEWVVQA